MAVRSLCLALSLGLLILLSSSPVLAQRATLIDSVLSVPRIDVDGFGPLQLDFEVIYTGQYRFSLYQAIESVASVPASGSYDQNSGTLIIDEVELVGGDLYSLELQRIGGSNELEFEVVAAVAFVEQPGSGGSTVVPGSGNHNDQNDGGLALFQQQCSNCHGADGAGTALAPSLIACASCGNATVLATVIRDTMPLGAPGSCNNSCANALAEYIRDQFNSSNEQVTTSTVSFLQQLGHGQTLRKAAQQLVSRLPTAAEFNLVATQGEYGLRQAVTGMLEEEAFYQRLGEIFNDYLLTDKYHSRNGSEAAVSLLSNKDFPNRRWFDPGSDNRDDNYSTIRRQTNDGIAREPLALINHVVRNNLPFTEILTADYMMMTPYSAKSYGVENLAFANPGDPAEFQPARLEGIPHAGILTSPMFLNRYPTTSTNRNRGRARVVFDLFLDTDILAIEGVRPGNAVDITTPIPTINNPQCSKCHSVLDPVASIFQNWTSRGQYRPARQEKRGWYTDMEPRGFNGEPMPLAGNVDSSVQWLAEKIAADPKFPRAVTRIVVAGITGKEPLQAPTEAGSSSAEFDAYVAERTLLNSIQERFVADNFNLKTLVTEIVMSPYWRASGLAGSGESILHAQTGSSYLLSPEQLDRKIETLLGFQWRGSLDQYYKDINRSWSSRLNRTYHQIYGGIDSDSVVTRLRSPNGLMGAMQLRMANELACYAVPHDFWLPENQRRLFLFVDAETNPYGNNGEIDASVMEQVRLNIQYLHEYLLAENLALTDAELDFTQDLFLTALNRGRQYILNSGGEWSAVRLPDLCDRTRDFAGNDLKDVNGEDLRLQLDRHFVIRAWMAVVAYLLADYKFVFS